MVKRYYIPTSSLNLNNILSTESISPKAFYQRRGFGNHRWETIPHNDEENSILLYEKPFHFSLPADGRENHPMWIIVDIDTELIPTSSPSVWRCDHTLYINPWIAKFLFLNPTHLEAAWSLALPSLEVKSMHLFRNRWMCGTIESKEAPIVTGEEVPLNETSMKADQRIDKIKGLLYGFYTGAILSRSPQIMNIYLSLFNAYKYLAFGAGADVEFMTGEESSQESADFLKLIQSSGMARKDLKNLRSLASLSWLKDAYRQLEIVKPLGLKIQPDESGFVLSDDVITNIPSESFANYPQYEPVILEWLNHTLVEINESDLQEKAKLATKLAQAAKNLLQDKWENSQLRTRLNAMGYFVDSQSDQMYWNDPIIAPLCAVLFRGDNWGKMLKFMMGNGMHNYAWAFAFYGMIQGYARLTRDFTDHLLKLDKEYVADTYIAISKQAIGKNFSIQSVDNGHPSILDRLIEKIRDIEPNPYRQEEIKDILEAVDRLTHSPYRPLTFLYIADNLFGKNSKFYKTLLGSDFKTVSSLKSREELIEVIGRYVGKITKKDGQKIKEAIAILENPQDPKPFLFVLDDRISATSETYAKICKVLGVNVDELIDLPKKKEKLKAAPIATNPQVEAPVPAPVPPLPGKARKSSKSASEDPNQPGMFQESDFSDNP